MPIRRLAPLVQLAVAEVESAGAHADQEAEPDGATSITSPNDLAVLVVLENSPRAGLAFIGHLRHPEDPAVEGDVRSLAHETNVSRAA